MTVTFANALARASVKDNLCGFSFGSNIAGGLPTMFATSHGVPPLAGV